MVALHVSVQGVVDGVVMYAATHFLVMLGKTAFTKTERSAAIWLHYHYRALQKGHQHRSVVTCSEGKCALI